MNQLQKSRVTVDFFMHERDVLQTLCDEDVRPPSEQLRWLVLNEARRRGLQPTPTNSKSDGSVFADTTGAFAELNP